MNKIHEDTEMKRDKQYYIKSKVYHEGFKDYKITKQLLSYLSTSKLKEYPVFVFYKDGINDIHIISEDCIVEIREAICDKKYGTYNSGKLIKFNC